MRDPGHDLTRSDRATSAPETTEATTRPAEAGMKSFHREERLRTAGGLSVTDITEQVQLRDLKWARLDSNQGPTDYESAALTS